METFAEPKALVANPLFKSQKKKSLTGLSDSVLDAPIIDIVNRLNYLPYCFTLQSCYGHFLYNGQNDPNSIEPLKTAKSIDRVKYRIAYVAFCVDCCDSGKRFLKRLSEISAIDNDHIQFCSAGWFWKQQVNSYALQVEPQRFKHQDTAILDLKEALHVENVRNSFFVELEKLLRKL